MDTQNDWKHDTRKQLKNWVKWARRVNLRRIGWASENMLYRLARYHDQALIHGSGLKQEDDDQEAELIDKAIQRLPVLYQDIIVMTYLDGLYQGTVAQEMGVSVKTFKDRMCEALAMIYMIIQKS